MKRLWLLAGVAAGVCLVPRGAQSARAPDVVHRSFEFRGPPAQALARLLVRMNLWGANSRPVLRSQVSIAFGPLLGRAGARCGKR
jgi:hypothetical protein